MWTRTFYDRMVLALLILALVGTVISFASGGEEKVRSGTLAQVARPGGER
jgi:hypothetical protein